MRTIKFRGRDYEGKWHKGSLIVVNVEKRRYKDVAPYEVYYIREQDFAGEEHEVDPETIGQLVFPATKMHPDIWEGDIIEDDEGSRLEIKSEPYRSAFCVIVRSKTGITYECLDEGYIGCEFKYYQAKVVGNIHDNPELITKPFCDHAQKAKTN